MLFLLFPSQPPHLVVVELAFDEPKHERALSGAHVSKKHQLGLLELGREEGRRGRHFCFLLLLLLLLLLLSALKFLSPLLASLSLFASLRERTTGERVVIHTLLLRGRRDEGRERAEKRGRGGRRKTSQRREN